MPSHQQIKAPTKQSPKRPPMKQAPKAPTSNLQQIDLLQEESVKEEPGILEQMDDELLLDDTPNSSEDLGDTESLYEAYFHKENRKDKNNKIMKDDVAKRMGLTDQRQGFFLLDDQEEYESDRHKGIVEKNQESSTDETYLSRITGDKTFEKDVPKELQYTRGHKTPKAMEKLRKMAVRSAKVIDEHAHVVTTTTVMVAGATSEMKDRRDERLEKMKDLLKHSGPENNSDVEEAISKEKDKVKEAAAKHMNWDQTHRDLMAATSVVSDKADRAHTSSQWVGEWEQMLIKQPNLDTRIIEKDTRAKVEVSLKDRKETKRHETAAKQVQDEMKKDELLDDGFMDLLTHDNKNPHGYKSKGKSLAKKTKGKIGTALMGALFGGFGPTKEYEDVEGGRKGEFKSDWFKPITNLKKVMADASTIRQSGTMGGKKASGVYAMLKVLSEGVIPIFRNILTSVGIWCVILAFFTLGGTIPVAAIAGALSLALTLLKLAIDFGLLAWSGIMSKKHTDHDHRKDELATGEAYGHFVDVVLGSTKVGMGLGTGMNSDGKQIGTGKMLKNRVKDVQGNNTNTSYGSTDLMKGGLMGNDKFTSPMGTHELNTNENLTTDYVLSGTVGGGLVKGMNTVNNKMIKGGGVKNVKNQGQKSLNQQSEKERLKKEEEERQLGEEATQRLDNRTLKVGQLFGFLEKGMGTAVGKIDPKALKKDVKGDPMDGVTQIGKVQDVVEDFVG